MDEFQVAAKDTTVLSTSHLVEEMQAESGDMDDFPVLIGKNVERFHEVSGGYHRDEGYHIVRLEHLVQGDGSPPSEDFAKSVEVHLDESSYYLEVEGGFSYGDYPNEDYVLCLKVTGYVKEPYSFADEMDVAVDKRETRYEK